MTARPRTEIFRDVLGLRHSVGGLTAGALGLAVIPIAAWLSLGLWANVASAVLVLAFAVDTVIWTLRTPQGGDGSQGQAGHPRVDGFDGTVRIGADYVKIAALTTVGTGLLLGSVFLMSSEDGTSSVLAGLCVALFALMVAVGAFFLVVSRELYVVCDSEGVRERTTPPRRERLVRWDEITRVELVSIAGGTSLVLHVQGDGKPVFVQCVFVKGGGEAVLDELHAHGLSER